MLIWDCKYKIEKLKKELEEVTEASDKALTEMNGDYNPRLKQFYEYQIDLAEAKLAKARALEEYNDSSYSSFPIPKFIRYNTIHFGIIKKIDAQIKRLKSILETLLKDEPSLFDDIKLGWNKWRAKSVKGSDSYIRRVYFSAWHNFSEIIDFSKGKKHGKGKGSSGGGGSGSDYQEKEMVDKSSLLDPRSYFIQMVNRLTDLDKPSDTVEGEVIRAIYEIIYQFEFGDYKLGDAVHGKSKLPMVPLKKAFDFLTSNLVKDILNYKISSQITTLVNTGNDKMYHKKLTDLVRMIEDHVDKIDYLTKNNFGLNGKPADFLTFNPALSNAKHEHASKIYVIENGRKVLSNDVINKGKKDKENRESSGSEDKDKGKGNKKDLYPSGGKKIKDLNKNELTNYIIELWNNHKFGELKNHSDIIRLIRDRISAVHGIDLSKLPSGCDTKLNDLLISV